MSTVAIAAGSISARRQTARGSAVATTGVAPARLTRRGRVVVSALAVLLLVVAAVLMSGGGPAAAGSQGEAQTTSERVMVRPGETLWAIAEREAPGVDPRETVARILDINALKSSAVRAGSVLLLPAR